MPYNSRPDVVRLQAEWYDTKSNVKLGGFRSQLQTSNVSSHTEDLWYNENACLLMTIYTPPYGGWALWQRNLRLPPKMSVCGWLYIYMVFFVVISNSTKGLYCFIHTFCIFHGYFLTWLRYFLLHIYIYIYIYIIFVFIYYKVSIISIYH